MARLPRKVKIQWVVARKKARLAMSILLLQRCEDLLRQRIEKLRVEVERIRIANHEMNIGIILHELILDRRSVADVPPDVLVDVTSLAEQRLMLLTDSVNFPRLEAALVPPPLEQPAAAAPPAASASGVRTDAPVDLGAEPRH